MAVVVDGVGCVQPVRGRGRHQSYSIACHPRGSRSHRAAASRTAFVRTGGRTETAMGYSRWGTYSGVSKSNLSRPFCRVSDESSVGISGGSQIDVTVAAQPFLFVRPVGHQLDERGDILLPQAEAPHYGKTHLYFDDMRSAEAFRTIHGFPESRVVFLREHFYLGPVQHQRNPGTGIVGT